MAFENTEITLFDRDDIASSNKTKMGDNQSQPKNQNENFNFMHI